MGKTITSIVLVAAAIAVNVIPGVGQAISATLVSAGLGTAAAAGIATIVTAGITSAGLTAGVGLVSGGGKLPKPPQSEGPLKTSIPIRVRAYGRSKLFGAYALFETSSAGVAVDVYAMHDGPIDGIEQRYLGDEVVVVGGTTVAQGADKRYKGGVVQWYETLGPRVNTAFGAVVALLPGIWTNDHRGDSVVTVATTWKPVKADAFQETYPQSGPVPASIVARWQRVFDWRDPTQRLSDETTWKWSENALLHLAHYRLCVEKAYRTVNEAFPSPAARQVAWDTFFNPTLAYWTEAANVCDEAVPLKSGGTEPRYRSSFSHKLNDPHMGVITSLTACFDGWTAPRADGALVVYAGRYYPPTVTIGPEHIVSYSWQDGIDDEQTVNEIRLTYISSDHDFGTVECSPWIDADDIARRGAIRSDPLENAVPSWGQARRLAKRLMARVMAPNRGTVTTNVAGRIARGQRYIRLRIVEAGAVFFDGIAEITQMTRNLQTGGVTFAWVAADTNIDAWNPPTEEGDPAANGNRVAPLPLDTPTVSAASVQFTGSTEEGTGGRIFVLANGPERDDLTWFARWRVQGAAVWNEQRYSDTDPTAGVELLTGFVPIDKTLEVEVAYQVGDGRVSDYSAPYIVDSDVDATPPDAATAITLTNWGDTLDLTADTIPRARSYRWRFYVPGSPERLVRTIVTTGRTVSYTKALAAADGASRAYRVTVAGVNAAGAGVETESGLLTNPAPLAVTGVTGNNDPTTGSVSFTLLEGVVDLAGYSIAYSTTAGFDPLTAGFIQDNLGASPAFIYGLAAGTYYAKVAAYDTWTNNPALLNFSAETTFVISVGGGSAGGGGGTGGGGGGYCVTVDTPVLMADGSERPAGDLQVGDLLWTQHEHSMAWGEHAVVAAETVESDDVWYALGIHATGDHRVWLGGGWVTMRDIGEPAKPARVVKLTVADAHTYVSAGVLSHNIKPIQQDDA